METAQARVVPGQRGVQSQASGANGDQTGGTSLRSVASRERPGQRRTDYRRRTETIEVEGGAPQRAPQDSSTKTGPGRAVEARNDPDDSRNRPALAHGKLEKPEQQTIFGEQIRCETIEIKRDISEKLWLTHG